MRAISSTIWQAQHRAHRIQPLRSGASALAFAIILVASPVHAQSADAKAQPGAKPKPATTEGDVIIVTGIRGSLQSARAIKKNSDTIVDSVSADDIGALPDRSVTETLQRIPGISINRFAAGVDPDHFSAEGSGVVVRGLTYVRSEFNGRDAFTANNGRALGFADVPAELLGGVDVYKSLPADHIEGGIAGTVDLKTRKPFDQKKSSLAITLENNYSDFADKSAPTGAVVGSYRTMTNMGEIGILGSFNYSKLFSRSDRIAVSAYKRRCQVTKNGVTTVTAAPAVGTDCPTGTSSALVPSGAVEGSQQFERTRIGMSAALQWRSLDRSMEATFQFLRSDAKEAWTEHTVEVTTDNVESNGGVVAAPGTAMTFDNNGVFTSGVITGNTGWRSDQQGTSARTPTNGLQSNNIRRDHAERNINNDFSANLKWNVTDKLTAVIDYQHVTSQVRVDDNTVWTSTYQDAQITTNGDGVPTISFLPATNCNPNCSGASGTGSNPSYYSGTHNSYLDPYNSFYRSSMDHTERSDGYENAAKIDLKYEVSDNGFIKSLKTGYRFADRNQVARYSTYNWGVLSEQWGNGGPVWLDTSKTGTSTYEVYTFDNFFGGGVSSPAGGGRLFYSGNTVTDYATYSANATAINTQWGSSGWVPLASRPGVVAGTPFLPGEINPANERNNAGYVLANFGRDFGGDKKLSGNIGVRYSRTNRTSYGGSFTTNSNQGYAGQKSSCGAIPVAQRTGFCTLATDVQDLLVASDVSAGYYNPSTVGLTYDYFLPSLNIKLEMGNGLQLRAAYFRGVAPPDFGLTRNYTKYDAIKINSPAGQPTFLSSTVTRGNPYLKPTTADNFDVSAEYYFGHGGQLTAAAFYKELKNVVVGDAFSSVDPFGSSVVYTSGYQPVNSKDTGTVKGFELSYQQNYTFLPGILSGFGLSANYTFADSKGVPQSTLSSTDPNVAAGNISNIDGSNFPLQGLSKHTVNFTPYYEVGPLSVRAAYTWRSQYLLTLRDVITPFDPIFQRAYGQLDASTSYAINSHFKIGLEGVNLLDSLVRTAAAVYDQKKNIILVPRAWYKTDKRYTLSAHLTF